MLKILLALLLLCGIYFFCEWQTCGFRLYHLLSNIPPNLDSPPIANPLLEQRFHFLGKGGFCYAFLGEDQKTVLKFYKHTYLSPRALLSDFSLNKLLLRGSVDPKALTPRLAFAFQSTELLFSRAQTAAGLLFLHLHKSASPKSVTLLDALGIRHTLDLSQTEFVLQERAEPLIRYLQRAMQEMREQDARYAIDSYLHCLLTLCKQGLRDLDRGFRRNYGILADKTVIAMDISSFVEDLSLQRPGPCKKEIVLKSHNLGKWLKKHHPNLHLYYDKKLVQLIEEA
jgi:hypothetical protein